MPVRIILTTLAWIMALTSVASRGQTMQEVRASSEAATEERDSNPSSAGVEPRRWNKPLPMFAQSVIDLGFDLPNPFGLAIVPNGIRQELLLSDLAVGLNGGELIEIDFAKFDTPVIENNNVQLKFDAWILPFVNIYATYGKMRGKGKIPLAVGGRDILDFLGLNCEGALAPPLCEKNLNFDAKPEYRGENYSLGLNVAMGWQRYFVTLPITYSWSNVDIIDNTVASLFVSPRIGINGSVGESGALAVFIGASYLRADVAISGSINLSEVGLNGDIPLPDGSTVDYRIYQRNKDRWNYLLGFNWDLSKSWSIQTELGTGGSRDNAIASLTWRF